jgi:PAS domain S-box-containing protein
MSEKCLDGLAYFLYYFGMKKRSEVKPGKLRSSFFEELRSADEIVRLLDWTPEVHFFAKDRDGRFMAVNRASLQRYGLTSEEEIIGKTDFDIHPPAMAAAYAEEDQRVMESGQPLPEQRWLVYDHSGVQRWFLSTKHPLFGRSGIVMGIAGLMRPLASSPFLQSGYSLLKPAVDRVLESYADQIVIPELARFVGLSVSQFERKFKAQFGMTPTRFITVARVNAARAMLAQGAESLGEVALSCGFYDQSQFSRLFKRETGTSPKEYRNFFR